MFMGFSIICIAFIAWKYYDFSGLDKHFADSCKYKSYSTIRKVLKIENKHTQNFCDCFGSRFQSSLGFINSITADKKVWEDSMDKAAYECRRAVQGN